MSLKLDRMAIEEVGLNPQRLAKAIHIQIGNVDGPVPVYEIAQALDIHEIREQPLKNLEAALITTPERGFGSILLNSNSNSRRRRFSVGHELLHFLNPQHEQTSADGFLCSRKDMRASSADTRDRHLRQEGEANEFAIELLTPPQAAQAFP
jgi:Zn-dependent peptidase ImmA (M78 family)